MSTTTAPPAGAAPLADHRARDRVRSDISSTLFVEAGAGTGKTTALIDRIVSLVASGIPMARIAAVTFTEKAAAELRVKLRDALEKSRRDATREQGERDEAAARRYATALEELDGAAVLTLHGFARRILIEHAVEAGLPPGFDVLADGGGDVAFMQQWDDTVERLLSDPSCVWAMEVLEALGRRPSDLEPLGKALNDNWDRLEDPHWEPHTSVGDPDEFMRRGQEVADAIAEAVAMTNEACQTPDDKMAIYVSEQEVLAERLNCAETDAELVAALAETNVRTRLSKTGDSKKWRPRSALGEVRQLLKTAGGQALTLRADVVREAHEQLTDVLRDLTLEAAEQRRKEGALYYHDLLVVARDVLTRDEDVRAAVGARYERLLLDEFQDTDPLQIEIATLIAALPGVEVGQWQQTRVAQGSLFFVGDPKQSIYRFRRADISLYLEASDRFGAQGLQQLSVNFRSTEPIVEWINHTFSRMVERATDEHEEKQLDVLPGGGPPLSAPYRRLIANRGPVAKGAAVTLLGAPELYRWGETELARFNEASDIAGTIRTLRQDWTVYDPKTEGADSAGERPALLRDVAILLPSRTTLPVLEQVLGDNDIPYRLESTSMVWGAAVVRDVMVALRAIADPSDELAVVSTLRSPLYGCGDDDLYVYRALGKGSFDYTQISGFPKPLGDDDLAGLQRSREGADAAERYSSDSRPGVVAAALAHLRELHGAQSTLSVGALFDKLVADRQLMEQAATSPRARDTWRQVRYVSDQARMFSESQRGGLREFLQWARIQADLGDRATEALLPEADDDAVRIMTIHAAKGLEFPIVIVSGLSAGVNDRYEVGIPRDGGRPEVKPPPHQPMEGWEAWERWKAREREADHHERIRLLYVACTRARDHLVVSLHRVCPQGVLDGKVAGDGMRHAQLIYDANCRSGKPRRSPAEEPTRRGRDAPDWAAHVGSDAIYAGDGGDF